VKSFQVLPNEGNGLQSVRVAMAMLFAVNGSVWQAGPIRQRQMLEEKKQTDAKTKMNTAVLVKSLIKLVGMKRNITA